MNLMQGVKPSNDGLWQFRIWAPYAEKMMLIIHEQGQDTSLDMVPDEYGFWVLTSEFSATKNILYKYAINRPDNVFPDPCSRFQPFGVHGFSQTYPDHFTWKSTDFSNSLPVSDWIIYELHIGTFSDSGDFNGAIDKIPYLKSLGVTHIEIMPVCAFSGQRNWGYDGVYPFSVHASYGGGDALKAFVDKAHQMGMGIILDVVYNHLGPEGNYLSQYGPYFTHQYHTPWGDALNFDGEHSTCVRHFFIQNAIQWLDEYRIDALRLDAVHAIVDNSWPHFLRELATEVKRHFAKGAVSKLLIAESDLSDVRMVQPFEVGGMGMDAQWLDDFHHCIHSLLTGERNGYYMDYGTLDHLIHCYNRGFVYNREYSPFRKRMFGSDSSVVSKDKFVAFIQNHDQVGNRFFGERLSVLLTESENKTAAVLLMLSPFVPLIFMGEEYLEKNPFYYFVSHEDQDLNEAVARGRKEEFKGFDFKEYEGNNPAEMSAFNDSKLDWTLPSSPLNMRYLNWYKALIQIRKYFLGLKLISDAKAEQSETGLLCLHSVKDHAGFMLLVNFTDQQLNHDLKPPFDKHTMLYDMNLQRTESQAAKLTLDPKSFVLIESPARYE